MNDQTRKALELARTALEWPAEHDADAAIAAIDAALKEPADPVAQDSMLSKLIYAAIMHDGRKPKSVAEFERASERVADMMALRPSPAAPVAQPLPACHVAIIGDRWDSERLHHVPQLLIEFEPVPANTGNTAKGWIDRDSLAKILSGIGQGGAA